MRELAVRKMRKLMPDRGCLAIDIDTMTAVRPEAIGISIQGTRNVLRVKTLGVTICRERIL
jgi:hypothetical protein